MMLVENPMIKELPAQLDIGYMDMVSESERIPNIERYIELWREMERREMEESRGSCEVSSRTSLLAESSGE